MQYNASFTSAMHVHSCRACHLADVPRRGPEAAEATQARRMRQRSTGQSSVVQRRGGARLSRRLTSVRR